MNALLIICGLGLVSLLAEITNTKKWLVLVIVIGLLCSGIIVTIDWNNTRHYYHSMLVFDNFSIAFTVLLIVISILWFWIGKQYFDNKSNATDRSALIVFAIAGASMMISFYNLTMLFLGIEILSIALYVLAGSRKDNSSIEAAFKYFIMGSFATSFFLFGVALVYGATGSFDLGVIQAHVLDNHDKLPGFFFIGVLLIFVGMAFKMSAVPFHFWAPDVYEGSPTIITAFMSTIVKIAAVVSFYKVFSICFSSLQPQWTLYIQVVAVITLIVANITAVFQQNIKRLLAYSSVGHIGYLLLLFSGNSPSSSGILFYYLAAYSIASLAAFGILHVMETRGEGCFVKNFNDLFKRNSTLAVSMTIAILSLAGIPPLAGFFAKYSVFSYVVDAGYINLVIVAVLASLISVFYYFKIIIAMFFSGSETGSIIVLTVSEKTIFILLTLITIALGLFPDVLFGLF